MRRKLSENVGNFSFSMLDIMACTVGFLLFLLFILAIITINLNYPIPENKLISNIKKYQRQRDKLLEEYKEKQNKYYQVSNEYKKLKKRWSLWKDWRIYLILLLLCIWMLFLLFQESKNKLRIQYSDYVIDIKDIRDIQYIQYIIHCFPDQLIIEQERITITLGELRSKHRTAFHDFCERLKNKLDSNFTIVLLLYDKGNATCVQAERIAYEMGVGNRIVIIPMEE